MCPSPFRLKLSMIVLSKAIRTSRWASWTILGGKVTETFQKMKESLQYYLLILLWSKSSADDFEMPTYFQFLTCMMFYVFSKESIDVAIIEVGIGGEYDYTNIIE